MTNQPNTTTSPTAFHGRVTEPARGAGKCTPGTPPPGTAVAGNSNPAIIPPPPRVFQTVEQLCNEQDALTVGMVRTLLFNRKTNGLQDSGAVVRVGRRLLLDRDVFLDWMWKQGQEAA